MSNQARSTLSEVNRKLAEVCYNILNVFDDKRWVTPLQLVYSTVLGWETSYEAYLIQRKLDNVKFPFASLTRNSTQETFNAWNKSFTAYEGLVEGQDSVKSVRIKPVRIEYILSIYDQRLEDIEAFADIIISQGFTTQKLEYFSNVLDQPSSISFIFKEPIHEMIPAKEDKRRGSGFVYGLNIPIIVDCVLGIKGEEKIIKEAILRTLYRIPDPLPSDITEEDGVEIDTVNEDDL